MHNDAANVSDHFTQASDRDKASKDPCLIAECEDEIDDCEGCEVGAEEGVRAEIGIVAVNCRFNGAMRGY